jgi:hypothetical protein
LGLLTEARGRAVLVIVDDKSPPGSWQREIDLMPWKYHSSQEERVRLALSELRAKGLWQIAHVLEQEIFTLRAERK